MLGQLYNIADDPFEQVDLWGDYPEKVQEMNQILETIKND